jgi:hypothetical protein
MGMSAFSRLLKNPKRVIARGPNADAAIEQAGGWPLSLSLDRHGRFAASLCQQRDVSTAF